MMSIREITRLSDEAAARAERRNAQPKVFGANATSESIRGIPNIGSYRPSNWQLVERDELTLPDGMSFERLRWLAASDPYLMCNKSGFGSRSEPALTLTELIDLIKANPTIGFAMVEEGQFQVVVGAFRKVGTEKPTRQPWMNKEDLARAFVKGEGGKCHNADTDGTRYRLHATDIAERLEDGRVRLNWGGWYTPTTASHMNTILWALGIPRRVSYATHRDADVDSFIADPKTGVVIDKAPELH